MKILLAAILVLFAASPCVAEEAPRLVTPAKVVDVYDGDTVTVEFTLRARIRLLDLWCPEIRGTRGEERERAVAARDRMRQLVLDKPVTVVVPFRGDELSDVLTFGRVLARIRVGGVDVSRAMVEEGHGTREKP